MGLLRSYFGPPSAGFPSWACFLGTVYTFVPSGSCSVFGLPFGRPAFGSFSGSYSCQVCTFSAFRMSLPSQPALQSNTIRSRPSSRFTPMESDAVLSSWHGHCAMYSPLAFGPFT